MFALALACTLHCSVAAALPQERAAATAKPLVTRWGRELDPEAPLPEYPRPHMVRKEWTNLNGRWDYAIRARGAGAPAEWDGKIVVPFCVESLLSGVGRRVSANEELWYRRSFRADCRPDQRLLLNFGAVDWQCEVFVDGVSLGVHEGGYDPFTFELPDLDRATEHQLTVRVWDPSDFGPQPVGKQRSDNSGIWYTPVTGIWQTVWTEPVSKAGYLRTVRISSPRVYGGDVFMRALPQDQFEATLSPFIEMDVNTPKEANRFGIFLSKNETEPWFSLITGELGANTSTTWHDAKLELWSPENPVMHSLVIRLNEGAEVIDEVRCAFAHREITVRTDGQGQRRVFLNGLPIFLLGPLDQGWWPDGLYTAPSDVALASDLLMTKRLGFNIIRKHVKVEPERWYWHCEQLGLLVWQDIPNPARAANWYPWREPGEGSELEASAPEGPHIKKEIRSIVKANPWGCIIAWTLYNEAWGQWRTDVMTQGLQKLVPDCIVDSASGGNDFGTGDLRDEHAYPGPAMPPLEDGRVSALGEFGGLGLALPGHLWREDGNWGYRKYDNSAQLTDHYVELLTGLRLLKAQGLGAAIYTQTTDVENEINGLLTYDREVLKMDAGRVRAANLALQLPSPMIETILPDARTAARSWQYTFKEPPGEWSSASFDDARWSTGAGGFGTAETPGAVVGTVWNTPDIWLRTSFDSEARVLTDALLWLHHDENVEIYLNGELIFGREGYVTTYVPVPIAKLTLRAGRNVIAVHCQQTGGGQYVDLGLARLIERAR